MGPRRLPHDQYNEVFRGLDEQPSPDLTLQSPSVYAGTRQPNRGPPIAYWNSRHVEQEPTDGGDDIPISDPDMETYRRPPPAPKPQPAPRRIGPRPPVHGASGLPPSLQAGRTSTGQRSDGTSSSRARPTYPPRSSSRVQENGRTAQEARPTLNVQTRIDERDTPVRGRPNRFREIVSPVATTELSPANLPPPGPPPQKPLPPVPTSATGARGLSERNWRERAPSPSQSPVSPSSARFSQDSGPGSLHSDRSSLSSSSSPIAKHAGGLLGWKPWQSGPQASDKTKTSKPPTPASHLPPPEPMLPEELRQRQRQAAANSRQQSSQKQPPNRPSKEAGPWGRNSPSPAELTALQEAERQSRGRVTKPRRSPPNRAPSSRRVPSNRLLSHEAGPWGRNSPSAAELQAVHGSPQPQNRGRVSKPSQRPAGPTQSGVLYRHNPTRPLTPPMGASTRSLESSSPRQGMNRYDLRHPGFHGLPVDSQTSAAGAAAHQYRLPNHKDRSPPRDPQGQYYKIKPGKKPSESRTDPSRGGVTKRPSLVNRISSGLGRTSDRIMDRVGTGLGKIMKPRTESEKMRRAVAKNVKNLPPNYQTWDEMKHCLNSNSNRR